MGVTQENLSEIYKRLPTVEEPPPGYLSINAYATRIGDSRQAVTRAVRSGRIPDRHIVRVFRKKTGKQSIAICWNATAYDYIEGKPQEIRPEDFALNPERSYKPIDTPGAENSLFVENADYDPLTDDKMTYRQVTDITSAKYRAEQLKIEKEQVALQIAKNKAILIADVVATQRQQAAELKAAFKSMIQRTAPKVASSDSVTECRQILEASVAEALKLLKSMEGDKDGL